MMKRLLITLSLCLSLQGAGAWHKILNSSFKSLQVVLNDDWTKLPVVQLGSSDVLRISFDELSHNYRRLIYRLEPCNPDWNACDGLFESDWLDGFNDRPIDNYANSLNTTVLYTHYEMQLPNADTRLKMSGNYKLHIIDEEADEEVVVVEFRVVEPLMEVVVGVTTNTDVDMNQSHQQVTMNVRYNALKVTNPGEQIQTFVLQNGWEDNMKVNVRPNYTQATGLTWEHNKGLIFEGGNEYRKFEVLDPSHPTMGLAHVAWEEAEGRFHVIPFYAEPRRNYVFDVDANGAFVVRNSDNVEIDNTSDYVYVHYKMKPYRHYADARVVVDGRWAVEPEENYVMEWDADDQSYNAVVLQKLGYYNYQILMKDLDGTTHLMPEEGSFYQTENSYTALVYYKEQGGRSWRLVGMKSVGFGSR